LVNDVQLRSQYEEWDEQRQSCRVVAHFNFFFIFKMSITRDSATGQTLRRKQPEPFTPQMSTFQGHSCSPISK